MDLPKNITQIGEADGKCRIYVEDYVVSFLKQLNPLARDKTMAAALYGRRQEEGEKTYFFVYGAGKLDFIQKETRHLSQAQRQEIEKIRQQYFKEYEFVGYRILDGEMVDGFHICEQDICRFVAGYAQFYEKNDAMLTYMLEARQEEAAPELVDIQKYDIVKNRQQQRRAKALGAEKYREGGKAHRDKVSPGIRGFQISAAAVFALLCVLGFSMNSSVLSETLGLDKLKAEFGEKKLEEKQQASSSEIQVDTMMVDDKLSQVVLLENETEIPQGDADSPAEGGESLENTSSQQANETPKEQTPPAETPAQEKGDETVDTQAPFQEAEGEKKPDTAEPAAGEALPEAYIVCGGDTLTGISTRFYGNEKQVQAICQLNGIENPDEIQIGQKILLP